MYALRFAAVLPSKREDISERMGDELFALVSRSVLEFY